MPNETSSLDIKVLFLCREFIIFKDRGHKILWRHRNLFWLFGLRVTFSLGKSILDYILLHLDQEILSFKQMLDIEKITYLKTFPKKGLLTKLPSTEKPHHKQDKHSIAEKANLQAPHTLLTGCFRHFRFQAHFRSCFH